MGILGQTMRTFYQMTQLVDTDGDSFGDNSDGTNGDFCPYDAGTSVYDVAGCPDDDFDGWSNTGDAFPDIPSQHIDSDGDGYGDNNTPDCLPCGPLAG